MWLAGVTIQSTMANINAINNGSCGVSRSGSAVAVSAA